MFSIIFYLYSINYYYFNLYITAVHSLYIREGVYAANARMDVHFRRLLSSYKNYANMM